MHLRKGVMIYQPIFSKSNDQSCLRGKSLLTKYLPESIFNLFFILHESKYSSFNY